jgi:predicted ATPase with chaperone activity
MITIASNHGNTLRSATKERLKVTRAPRLRRSRLWGLIGGGQVPMPGEVSLAYYGVLFPGELPDFLHHIIKVVRQALADGFWGIFVLKCRQSSSIG